MSEKLLKRYINELMTPYVRASTGGLQVRNLLDDGSTITSTGFFGLGTKPTKIAGDAACAVIMNPKNKFLAVSRPNDPFDFGFPGGHVEKGESPEEAIVREIGEETGLTCSDVARLASLRNSDGRKVHFFTCDSTGEINTNEPGIVKWASPDELLRGKYGEEARVIFRILGLHI